MQLRDVAGAGHEVFRIFRVDAALDGVTADDHVLLVGREDLDRVAPDNPLVLMDASYHGCFVNSAALEEAGFDGV